MGAGRPIPGASARGFRPAQPRVAQGVQRAALHRQDGCTVALHASQPAALGGGLPADRALAVSRVLCRAVRRAARGSPHYPRATGCSQRPMSDCGQASPSTAAITASPPTCQRRHRRPGSASRCSVLLPQPDLPTPDRRRSAHDPPRTARPAHAAAWRGAGQGRHRLRRCRRGASPRALNRPGFPGGSNF